MDKEQINSKYELSLKLWKTMFRIRKIEERIALRYPENKMRCPIHLSIGQEAVPGALAANLSVEDFAVSTHRGHAHFLAKGGNLDSLIGELYGKVNGCCLGKGGSMHLIDVSAGFMGTTAIVGNSIPIGVGLALASQLNNSGQISCIYLGDGATEEGVFYESINFSIVRKLPALFICENNLYSVYSPLAIRQPHGRKIFEMVAAMGMKTANCDGNDVLACNKLVKNAVEHIRATGQPFFLEFSTYRWREHCGPDFDNDLDYRSKEEFDFWQSRDPIKLIESSLFLNSQFQATKAAYEISVANEIDIAFSTAELAPFGNSEIATKGVYA